MILKRDTCATIRCLYQAGVKKRGLSSINSVCQGNIYFARVLKELYSLVILILNAQIFDVDKIIVVILDYS